MMLTLLIILPLIGILFLFFLEKNKTYVLNFFAFTITVLNFFVSVFLWILFDKSTSYFQFNVVYVWGFQELLFGIDGISLFFILLTTFLIPLCILSNWYNPYKVKSYLINFLIIEVFLIVLFSTLNLFVFFICFESILIPLFIIIGLFGSGARKVRSGFFFFFYTFCGSVLMLVSLLFLYTQVGTFNYQLLNCFVIKQEVQIYLWIGFIFAFLTKLPVIPFHLWLPEAHVEAPTSGSVLLAGILLKLGTYGIIRFLLPLFTFASYYFAPIIYMIGGVSVIYSSGVAIRQVDLKRVIAYTSIAHMNLVLIGLFSFNLVALMGSIFQMLSHGLVSSALFFCIGFLYERTNTRLIDNFGGLVQLIPNFIVFFFIFMFANMSFPGTSNFVGEVLLLVGIFANNYFISFIGLLGMVLSGIYTLWVFNRVAYGNLKLYNLSDLNHLEGFILLSFVGLIFLFGLNPGLIMDYVYSSSLFLVEFV